MKKLYVRVQPKQGAERFFRCGIEFRQAWKEVEVDAATAARLEAEQMLEVSETKPAELENEAPNEADPSGDSTAVTGSDTPAAAPNNGAPAVPEDPTVRLEAIRAAIGQLNKEDAALWTAGGKAKTEAIAAVTGWPVTAAERDAATAEGGAQ
jgi:hypothetical protein